MRKKTKWLIAVLAAVAAVGTVFDLGPVGQVADVFLEVLDPLPVDAEEA